MNAQESDITSLLQAEIVPFITKREKACRQSTSLCLSIFVLLQTLNDTQTDASMNIIAKLVLTTLAYSQGKGEHDEMTFDLIS